MSVFPFINLFTSISFPLPPPIFCPLLFAETTKKENTENFVKSKLDAFTFS